MVMVDPYSPFKFIIFKLFFKINILDGIMCYPTVPSLPPQSVEITSTNPASLKVSWQPPLEKICTTPIITGYMIEYSKDGPQDCNDWSDCKDNVYPHGYIRDYI